MPETPFPPDFTKCADCGCCVAKVYAGNAAICWECDEGKPCKGRADQAAAGHIPRQVASLDKTTLKAARILKKSPLKAEQRIDVTVELPDLRSRFDRDESKTGRKLIPPEIKAAIALEPLTLTGHQVAKKYGVSQFVVSQVRIAERKAGRTPAAAPCPAAPILPSEELASEPPKVIPMLGPAPTAEPTIRVTVQISEAAADWYWLSLNADQKVAMIRLQLLAILERGEVPHE